MDVPKGILYDRSDSPMANIRLAHVCNMLPRLGDHIDDKECDKLETMVLERALELADLGVLSRALSLLRHPSSTQRALIAKVIEDHGFDSIRAS